MQFIFPVYQAEHLYIICVNIKGGRVDVVDNSPAMQNLPMRHKYGTVTPMLGNYMVKFLLSIGLKTKAKKLCGSRVYRVDMPWHDDANKIDCAIYAMRHMDRYFGQPHKEWDCGITLGGSSRQLKNFREKYCAAILADELNNLHKHNMV
ncbi:hypothetical protein CASFOL_023373 [Castilleja foliolosa]|uniref:Ubiquitin-like protease family profile domain-containing protein n=1 Tax=Castilleja foliolosa TaxID=1961234 RepID=A0ABD3CLJ3_9LAMI